MTNQPSNEKNENNFVNLVNSCNVNNVEIIQINASSVPAVQQSQEQDDLVSSLTSKPSSIYWNEQNEEAFLQEIELQNLFANTLLHDDFADEADFTCLGIDQLQLNYPSVATNNQNSNSDHESLINKQNDDFIHISHQTLQQSEAEAAAAATEQFNTFNSIDLSSVTSLINENNLASNNQVIQSESEPEPDTQSQTQTQTHKQHIASDDSVFKKPNLIDSFFSNNTNNNKLINLIEPIELISQLKKINTQVKSNKQELNDKQQQQQPATNGFLANSIFSLKRSRKRSKLLALGPTAAAAAAAGLNSKVAVNGQDSALITSVQNTTNNTKLSNSKLIKLNIQNKKEKKEKLKQTKGLLSEPSNKKFAACVTAVVHEELPISTTLNSLMLKTKKEDVDLHIKELSLLDLHSSEEDSAEILIKNALNAKLKKDNRSSSNENSQSNGLVFFPGTTNNNSKLSTTNQLNEIISKRIKYSTNPLNEATDNCSSVSSISSENQFNQNQPQSEFTSESVKKERRIDKLIQYLTKSSLDSAGSSNCSMSSSTSSNESLQIQKLNSSESFLIINNLLTKNETTLNNPIGVTTSTVNSNTSYVTSSNQQNKRKKNDASETQQQQLLISSSLPIEIHEQKKTPTPQLSAQNSTELSKSLTIIDRYIENDTLQHMKNLDLNFDLKPNEFSNGFSSSSSSSCSSSTNSTKPKEKNIYKKNKKTLHSMGNNLEQLTVSLQQQQHQLQPQPQPLATANESVNLGIDLNDACSRKTLWNLLKAHSSQEEIMDEFGSQLHDKISFWDLVKLKLKFSKSTQLKTTYEIIDDYTVLYSNMSTLLESFVEEHSSTSSSTAVSTASKLTLKKNENSSRSRSSSRNCRKQSSNSSSTLSHRI